MYWFENCANFGIFYGKLLSIDFALLHRPLCGSFDFFGGGGGEMTTPFDGTSSPEMWGDRTGGRINNTKVHSKAEITDISASDAHGKRWKTLDAPNRGFLIDYLTRSEESKKKAISADGALKNLRISNRPPHKHDRPHSNWNII